ncbi:hypothetical protein M427DRAFT_51612 [Gonapodya prolifera JEL478]|uniref:Uncharacterized protein n=1 Tax=Gonapodya prolifera (strain JEL478) TaxID=1344416 RepID=A0A139AXC0_GONPJ|nr:hypothetical protein M427DRAFT_51612 [Gonapodya prolifera JEL478]|eukprot:KXS21392.1 hypothetical protein M427DRAFT_51612 [Gonapodya prolifera JEL478]
MSASWSMIASKPPPTQTSIQGALPVRIVPTYSAPPTAADPWGRPQWGGDQASPPISTRLPPRGAPAPSREVASPIVGVGRTKGQPTGEGAIADAKQDVNRGVFTIIIDCSKPPADKPHVYREHKDKIHCIKCEKDLVFSLSNFRKNAVIDRLRNATTIEEQKEILRGVKCNDCVLKSRTQADPRDPLSKICHTCQMRLGKKEFSARQWREKEQPRCEMCVQMDADVGVAILGPAYT